MLEWQGVSVSLPGRGPVLTDVSGDAAKGKVTALVGPSGAGSSVLIDTLAGRLPSGADVSGEIMLAGRRITRLNGEERAADMSTVRLSDLDTTTTRDLFSLLDRDELDDLPSSDDYIGSLPPTRAAIFVVAALRLAKGEVVLVDQPMVGAAPSVARRVGAELRRLAAEGRTVLWAEHDIDKVWEFADAVLEFQRPGPSVPIDDWRPGTVREASLQTLSRLLHLPHGEGATAEAIARHTAGLSLSLTGSPQHPSPGAPRTVSAEDLGLLGAPVELREGETIGIVAISGRAEPTARRLTEHLKGRRVPTRLPQELSPRQIARQWSGPDAPALPSGLRPMDPLCDHGTGDAARLRLALAMSTDRLVWFPQPQLGLDQMSRLALAARLLAGRGAGTIVTTVDVEFLVRSCHRILILDDGRILSFATPSASLDALPERPLVSRALPNTRAVRIGHVIEELAGLTGVLP